MRRRPSTGPSEEIVYVLSGTLEYKIEDDAIRILRAGEVLIIPSGKAHSAINIGVEDAAELTTYVVEKGKPLSEIVK